MIDDSRRRAGNIRNVLLVLCVLAMGVGAVRLWRMARDPDVALLIGAHGAEWICFDSPLHLAARSPEDFVTFFRKTVRIEIAPAAARLVVQSFRLSNVQIDGVQALGPWDDLSKWKEPREADVAKSLGAGNHTVIVEVFNKNGPPALLVHCGEIGLRTDESWEASLDGQSWKRVRLAKSPRWAKITSEFPSSGRALLNATPWLALVFLSSLVVALFLIRNQQRQQRRIRFPSPAIVRSILLGAWIVLAINNICKLPSEVGFDVYPHLDYILFIHHHGKLPLATDGWQMFEAPLYYLVSIPIVKIALSSSMELPNIIKFLRIIPLLCALAQIEICYRIMRLAFPSRRELQTVGILIGGLLPMLLYRSQTIGTEPMAGALSAATIWLALANAYGSPRFHSWIGAAAIGAMFGLALLTKVSAILLAPALVGWIISIGWLRGERIARSVQHLGIVIAIAALLAGWYYARNWIKLGKPFVGGWDPSRQIDWWQEPGYRTPEEFLRFGRALMHPVWAPMAGFWDGLYSTMWTDGTLSSMILYDHRPPWNFNFLLSASLLAVIPTALMLIGVCTAFNRSSSTVERAFAPASGDGGPAVPPPPMTQNIWFCRRGAIVFSMFAIAIYLAAIFDLHLTAPIHSTAKATYTMGLTPCYALLIAAGFGTLARNPVLRAIIIALLATWSFNSLAAFIIL